MNSAPECVWEVGAELGEGPMWSQSEQAVYFVDILGKAIHRWQIGGLRRSWKTPAEPGFVFPCLRGGMICGLRGGLYRFEPVAQRFERLIAVEADKPRHRINDGFVDATGRLWFGTMHEDTATKGGSLYSLEPGPTLRVHDTGYTVTNGPVASPDGSIMYHADSARRTIYAFAHANGELSQRRVFATFPQGVYPDGMAVDSAGYLWVALFNGWRLERYSPSGDKAEELRLPCANVTKPAFGGIDLKTLFVTTGWCALDAPARARQPQAGALFSTRVAVPGAAPTPAVRDWE